MTAQRGTRDGRHPDKRRQIEQPEEYGQVAREVPKGEGRPHPGTKERASGAQRSGAIEGGEHAKPGQMSGDEDKSAKED